MFLSLPAAAAPAAASQQVAETCNTTYLKDSSPQMMLDLEINTQHAVDQQMFVPAEQTEAIEEATENKMR